MSFKASKWARVQRLHKTPKAVLTYLAERADNRSYHCYAGQKVIAAGTGLSERTVRVCLKYLAEFGFIEREERRRNDGYRTSDTITVLVSDNELYVQPYGEWYRENASHRQPPQSHRQPTTLSPATVAGPNNQELRSVDQSEATSTTSSSRSSTDMSTGHDDARGNITEEMMDALVAITLAMVEAIPQLQDEDLMKQWAKIKFTSELPYQDHPGMTEANLALIETVEEEVRRRFGGVS